MYLRFQRKGSDIKKSKIEPGNLIYIKAILEPADKLFKSPS